MSNTLKLILIVLLSLYAAVVLVPRIVPYVVFDDSSVVFRRTYYVSGLFGVTTSVVDKTSIVKVSNDRLIEEDIQGHRPLLDVNLNHKPVDQESDYYFYKEMVLAFTKDGPVDFYDMDVVQYPKNQREGPIDSHDDNIPLVVPERYSDCVAKALSNSIESRDLVVDYIYYDEAMRKLGNAYYHGFSNAEYANCSLTNIAGFVFVELAVKSDSTDAGYTYSASVFAPDNSYMGNISPQNVSPIDAFVRKDLTDVVVERF